MTKQIKTIIKTNQNHYIKPIKTSKQKQSKQYKTNKNHHATRRGGGGGLETPAPLLPAVRGRRGDGGV